MRKEFLLNCCLIFCVAFICMLIFSCGSTKKTKYFQDIPDSGKLKNIPAVVFVEPKVDVDDILSITIRTVDPVATQSINIGNIPTGGSGQGSGSAAAMAGMSGLGALAGGAGNTTAGFQPADGYLVDKQGNVDVPILGKIHVVGYSTSQLKDIICNIASKYYNNPTVIIRFANFKINVLGEVMRPGVYIMPSEKVSLLDALAMAGDLTIYGKRDNVLLIRENLDGTKTPYRIDLKNSGFMSSPYYYLRQNDVIYVEPSKAKAAATDVAQARNYTIIGSVLSLLAIILTRKN